MRLIGRRSDHREPGRADTPRKGTTDAPYIRVMSYTAVEELVEIILDTDREQLVVVLSARSKVQRHSVDVHHARAIVGPSASIYYLPTGPYSRDLADRVPQQRGTYNGSLRAWLPGVAAEDDQQREHSSVGVYDPSREYGAVAIRSLAFQLADAFTARGIKPEVDPAQAHRALEISRVRAEAEETRRQAEEDVKQARKERDEALSRERQAERRLRMAERDSGVTVGDQDPEGALRMLILQRWLDLSYDEREQHPLARDFVRNAESLTYLTRDRLAYVCAMIASARVDQLASLARTRIPPRDEDKAKNVERWQCNLTRLDSQSPPAVRYEQSEDATIVFTGTGMYGDPVGPRR